MSPLGNSRLRTVTRLQSIVEQAIAVLAILPLHLNVLRKLTFLASAPRPCDLGAALYNQAGIIQRAGA